MEKKIEDYLHLYLGCDLLYKGKIIKNIGIKNFTPWSEQCSVAINRNEWTYSYEVKPLLRPLSDMTEEEKVTQTIILEFPEVFRYLLSKGFDLFGLIESGLAIDKTKLKYDTRTT